jgi:predicted RNA-binding Zn-ribbon protein involved in translation (DUF1610 family)
MIEFDVDMGYLLECDELDKVVLNDEDGEYEPMEFILKDATAGNRSCASCPEMDNPDSYIMHMHRALEVADRGAGTCEGSFHESGDLSSGRVPLYYCKGTNKSVFVEHDARFCPMCGRRSTRRSQTSKASSTSTRATGSHNC